MSHVFIFFPLRSLSLIFTVSCENGFKENSKVGCMRAISKRIVESLYRNSYLILYTLYIIRPVSINSFIVLQVGNSHTEKNRFGSGEDERLCRVYGILAPEITS